VSERPGALLTALGAAAVVVVSSAYLLVARLLHYATVALSEPLGRAVLVTAIAAALAVLHERLVRGALYARLRARMTPGLAAPATAVIGALVPAFARLALVPQPRVPLWLLGVQGFLTDFLLGLGLCWLVLGTGSWAASGAALALVFCVRLLLHVTYHGGVVPVLEMLSAGLAALAVAGVLAAPLAPHRDAVMEA
jgi:hypothetical protein